MDELLHLSIPLPDRAESRTILRSWASQPNWANYRIVGDQGIYKGIDFRCGAAVLCTARISNTQIDTGWSARWQVWSGRFACWDDRWLRRIGSRFRFVSSLHSIFFRRYGVLCTNSNLFDIWVELSMGIKRLTWGCMMFLHVCILDSTYRGT